MQYSGSVFTTGSNFTIKRTFCLAKLLKTILLCWLPIRYTFLICMILFCIGLTTKLFCYYYVRFRCDFVDSNLYVCEILQQSLFFINYTNNKKLVSPRLIENSRTLYSLCILHCSCTCVNEKT